MPDHREPAGQEEPEPKTWFTYVFLAFCLLIVHAVLVGFRAPGVLHGSLIDTDSYSRLIRVDRLHETGLWFDSSIPRMNSPFGLDFHWTRPLDVLLLFGGWLLSPLLGFKTALYWSGVLVSPLLHILACLALAWAVGPLFVRERRPLAMIVLLAQPIVVSYAVAGRVDHHILLVLLYVLSFGFYFRLMSRASAAWAGVMSGAIAGLGVWVSVEFLLPALLFQVSFVTLWVLGCRKIPLKGLLFSVGLMTVVGFSLMAEHPPSDLLTAEYDRISAPHLLLSVMACVFWGCILWVERRNRLQHLVRTRVLFLGLGIATTAGILLLSYPGIFSNPMTDVDPRFWNLFVRHIEELQPLFPRHLSQVGTTVTYLGMAGISIPFSLWMILPRHGNADRALWLPVFVGLLVSVPLGLHEVRYGLWVGVPSAIAVTGFLDMILHRMNAIRSDAPRALFRAALIAGVLVGPLFLGEGLTTLWKGSPVKASLPEDRGCSVQGLARALSLGVYGEVPRTLVANPDIGPELVYRTKHSVVAAPYHRNLTGILDTYDMLASSEEVVSRGLMDRRNVELVTLCPGTDRGFFQQAGSDDGSLFTRLVDGHPPSWIKQIELPGSIPHGFLVFKVVGE